MKFELVFSMRFIEKTNQCPSIPSTLIPLKIRPTVRLKKFQDYKVR